MNFLGKKIIEYFFELNIPEKMILNNPLNWILSWNEWMNHILNRYLPFLMKSPLFCLFWTLFGQFLGTFPIRPVSMIPWLFNWIIFWIESAEIFLNWTIFWIESWESLVVLFKFLGLLKKGRLKPSSSLLKLTFLDFSIHHFKNGGFEILNWPSWGSVDVWCLTGPAEEGLKGLNGSIREKMI